MEQSASTFGWTIKHKIQTISRWRTGLGFGELR